MINTKKVFGIGFHKTGTSSLGFALNVLGYQNCRGLKAFKAKWGQEQTLKYLNEKEYQPFFDFLVDYNACQDNPWYLMYKELDKQFPNSKFILTKREIQNWKVSCQNFFSNEKKPIHQIIYGTSDFSKNESVYVNRYLQHNQDVLNYFKNRPNDLLVVDWENGDGWRALCTFLDKPLISLPFPRLNEGKYRIKKTC